MIATAGRGGPFLRRPAHHRGARRSTRSWRSCSRPWSGHLFGYEAALAIDAQARPLREARAAIEAALGPAAIAASPALGRDPGLAEPSTGGRRALAGGAPGPGRPPAARFFAGLRAGAYNGHLEASTAVEVASLLRYASGTPADRGLRAGVRQGGHPERHRGRPDGGPDHRHGRADPARRRHQAPGQDGHGGDLPQRGRPAQGAAWWPRPSPPASASTACPTGPCGPWPSWTPRSPRSTASPATASTVTWRPTPPSKWSTGAASPLGLASRTERDPRLLGTKHHVAAEEREVTVARGGRDGRSLILVPETKGQTVTGHDPPPRGLPRPAGPGRGPPGPVRLPQPLRRPVRRRHRDGAGLRRRAPGRGPAAGPAHRAGVRAGRTLDT